MNFVFSSEIFSSRLKDLRLSRSITQVQLAKDLCMTKAAISNLENQQKKPSLETAILLASYFQVSLDYLSGLSNTKERQP